MAYRRLWIIKKYKYTLSHKTLEIGYITFISPILEYGDVIYDACSIEDTTKLEKVQLEAARIVTGTKFRTSSNEHYLELGWLTLKIRRQFYKLSKLFTITKNQYLPYKKKQILDSITNYHSHATRGHITSQLPIPKCKSEFSKKSFFPSTIKLWNELHGTIRDSVNKSSFKKALCSSKFKTSSRIYPSNIVRSTQVNFTQIRGGFINLNDDLYCKGCTDTHSCDSGHIIEDPKHFL